MNADINEAVEYLRSPDAIRERSEALFASLERGESEHFTYNPDHLDDAADLVVNVTRANYPDGDIPFHSRWRHFSAGGVDRTAWLDERLRGRNPAEIARAKIELAIVSVLLDAGAGLSWGYEDKRSGKTLRKSEGLAAASFDMFADGRFSATDEDPFRVDAEVLSLMDTDDLAEAFQISAQNPILGIDGRCRLLRGLGAAVKSNPLFFGESAPRLGFLYDHIARDTSDATVEASFLLRTILTALAPIWPGRLTLDGHNLGDVWPHPKLTNLQPVPGLLPFHKLSQWLTYSMIEPLEEAGFVVRGLDRMTGLPEYRNGGLFVDTGVLSLNDPAASGKPYKIDDPLIVEWRAYTICLLDRLAGRVRLALDVSAESLPLVKVLQGGTWAAGRRIAQEKRSDGAPPIALKSDGTVF